MYLCRPNALFYCIQSVRRYILIVFAALYCLCASAYTKLTPETTHFIGLWGGLGYSGWLHSMDDIKPLSGVAPSVGVGYRLLHNGFVFQTGLEGQYTWVKGKIPDMNRQVWMDDHDIPNEQFQMNVTFSDYSDVTQTMNVQVPVLLGCEYKRFYMLAGMTVGASVFANAKSQATMTTQGQYERYIGMMEDIPNHGFETAKVKSGTRQVNMGVNLLAHLEVGARLDKFNPNTGYHHQKHTYRLYLGAFAEYGLLNIHSSSSQGSLLNLDFSHGVQADMTPFMLCDEMKGGKVNPLTVGIKCTVMFELPKPGKSYIYDYYESEHDRRKRGGNQGINY